MSEVPSQIKFNGRDLLIIQILGGSICGERGDWEQSMSLEYKSLLLPFLIIAIEIAELIRLSGPKARSRFIFTVVEMAELV